MTLLKYVFTSRNFQKCRDCEGRGLISRFVKKILYEWSYIPIKFFQWTQSSFSSCKKNSEIQTKPPLPQSNTSCPPKYNFYELKKVCTKMLFSCFVYFKWPKFTFINLFLFRKKKSFFFFFVKMQYSK